MAVFWHVKWTFCCLFTLLTPSLCQRFIFNRPISQIEVNDCNQDGVIKQFYDTSKLECSDCSPNAIASEDRLSCVCPAGYRYVNQTNHGGRGVECAQCPTNQVASSTGYNCVTLPTSNSSREVCPERQQGGAWSNPISCLTCSADTQPNAEKTSCEKCTTTLPVTENNPCSCPTTDKVSTGGFCIPKVDLSLVVDNPSYEIPSPVSLPSGFLDYNLRSSYALCNKYTNITACQALANMCVMTMYEYNRVDANSQASSACEIYIKVLQQKGSYLNPVNAPWLYYFNQGGERIPGDDILFEDYIATQYTVDPLSYLDYRLARYSLEGQYLGMETVSNGKLQLCADTTKRLNSAYVFGTSYSQSCKKAAIDLWDRTRYPTDFFDPYLLINQNEAPELYPIPVNVLNYRSRLEGSDEINRGGSAKDYQLFRRFFLVDNVGTIPNSGGNAAVVRYAKNIEINVILQTDTTSGIIYPPAIKIDYSTVTREDAENGAEVEITFKVDYSYTDTSYKRDFQIAIGTLSTLGVLFAGYRTWVWSKRSGQPTINFPTIANFFFYCAGTLANVFFVVTFGMAFYWFIFFKRQSVVYLIHPSDDQLQDWLGLFGAAFALKFLEIVHVIILQCTIDVFFIDWERSRGVTGAAADSKKSKEIPVSIWRTYFVANEWNEIQAVRKINQIFQVWAVVFFLVVVGFENTTTMDPDGSVEKDAADYKAPYSKVYRYALAVMVYIVIGVVQWIFFTFIYERFFEDKIRQFVDLCSMSNISVFVMGHAQYGHYIHGRSVHGKADTNMREMFEMMKKEEEDMVGQRGLLPNTEQQTFIMALPRRLRLKYEQVLLPAQLESAAASNMEAGRGGRITGTAMEKQSEAYTIINRFLAAFIDRSLKDLDYVIKDKTFLESIMDTEFYDATETGIFYNDNGHSFDNVLFYGNEMTLMLFDVLTFCIVDLIFMNYVVAGVVTYLLSEIMCFIRASVGQKNLARKTLIDDRFLI